MIEYLSQSMLNMWARCPEQFRRRYIDNDIIPPKIAARIGTGLHKGAQVNHVCKRITHKDEPLSVVQDAARDGYIAAIQEGVFFTTEEVSTAKKQLAEGVDVTTSLARVYHESLAPLVNPELVEEKLILEIDELPIPFAGTIDVYTSDKWWLDMKSAEKKWPLSKADNDIQATLYNELIRERTGTYPKKLSFEVFTKSKLEHQTVETTRTPQDFETLILRAKAMLDSIKAGVFMPADPSSFLCSRNYCGYWNSCPYISTRLKNSKAQK